MFIDRNRTVTQNKLSSPKDLTSGDLSSSELYHTPNNTINRSVQPDLIPRGMKTPLSPMSDDSEFLTPNASNMSPISPVYLKSDHSFAVPSYFDRKKQDVMSLARSAVNVLPLSNFQIFKQKSLNTIPDFMEKEIAKEQLKEEESGLFHNFPFLTPLANRKNSLYEKHRLSSCNEDEFYVSPDPDVEFRHTIRSAPALEEKHATNPVRHTYHLSEAVLGKLGHNFGHSTPKSNAKEHRISDNDEVFLRNQLNNADKLNRFAINQKLRPSKSGIAISAKETVVVGNPLRHSHTVGIVPDKMTATTMLRYV